MLVDTHCHLADRAFDADRSAVLERAWAAGVQHVVVIGETPETAAGALSLTADARVSATAGLHPHEARRWSQETESWLTDTLNDSRVVAAGEMGLDYHYDFSPRDRQREVFERQLQLAEQAGKPAVIHAREADADVAAILRNHPRATAILHSFSSGLDLLRVAIALGHYVSLSGMITFRNWSLAEALTEPPLDRLLVETDAPYLAPVPYRGKRNEPAFVRHTLEHLARKRGLDPDDLTQATGLNARRVFGPRLG